MVTDIGAFNQALERPIRYQSPWHGFEHKYHMHIQVTQFHFLLSYLFIYTATVFHYDRLKNYQELVQQTLESECKQNNHINATKHVVNLFSEMNRRVYNLYGNGITEWIVKEQHNAQETWSERWIQIMSFFHSWITSFINNKQETALGRSEKRQ